MIQAQSISKHYGKQTLFREASFLVGPGERLGIVGRNGHGKSTLFKLILGTEELDGGAIVIPKHYRIGHLSQKLNFTQPTVMDEACLALPEQEGGWFETYKAEEILTGLGFTAEQLARPPSELSGGFQVRLSLGQLLLSEPNLLLLDEPTNYLDIVSVRWLSRFLQNWKEELMLITHDRGFMDNVCTHTLAIHRERVKKIEGGTAKLYEQISLEEEIHEKTRLNQRKKREEVEQFIERFRAKASKAAAVQSRVKALEREGELEELQNIQNLSFSFSVSPFQGKYVLQTEHLGFGFDKEHPLFSNITLSIGREDRIGIIGKNGKGKTTLLRVLVGDLTPTGGKVVASEKTAIGYFGQTNVDRLSPDSTIEDEVSSANRDLSRTAVRSICGAVMFEGDSALKKIRVLSGGERSRVLLGKVLAHPANVLFLDEPTNHLDMQSADSLLDALEEFPGAAILVTHDEHFLRRLANRLIVFDHNKVTLFEGGYDDFLRRIGWEDEEQLGGGNANSGPDAKLSKKELRKQRAEEQQRRAQSVGPLDQEIAQIEAAIAEAETRQKAEQQKLIEITSNGYSDEAAKLSRSIHLVQQSIEELFSKLEAATKAREKLLPTP